MAAFEADGSAVWPRLLKIPGKNPFKQSLVREKHICLKKCVFIITPRYDNYNVYIIRYPR